MRLNHITSNTTMTTLFQAETMRTYNKPICHRTIVRNTDCPITYEEIKEGDEYIHCDKCNYNFSKDVLTYLPSKGKCPMCRAKWTINCVYVNKARNPIDEKKCAKNKQRKQAKQRKQSNTLKCK